MLMHSPVKINGHTLDAKQLEDALFNIGITTQTGKDHINNSVCENEEFNIENIIQVGEEVQRQANILLGMAVRLKEDYND